MDIIADGKGKVILARGGTKEKYLATIEEISDGCPQKSMVPKYYRGDVAFYGSFLKIVSIESGGKRSRELFCLYNRSKNV